MHLSDAARIAGGSYHGPDRQFHNICTDSREADADSLFVALRGETTDGHKYIPNVIQAGCTCVLCEEILPGFEAYSVRVRNTVQALGALASAHREDLNVRTIGVTGSVGKTTTKEYIYAVLSGSMKTEKTEANHNSVIGMPLDLLRMRPGTEAAVLEMGMSAMGEIRALSGIGKPSIAMITNIGTSHEGMLGSRENIFKAKMEIVQGMAPGGKLILNGDEPLFAGLRGSEYRPVYVGINNAASDVFADNIRYYVGKTLFDLYAFGKVYRNVSVPTTGFAGVYAALYAWATGTFMDLKPSVIREGLKHYSSVGLRQQIEKNKGLTLIEDCYNASPESMRAAMDLLNIVRGKTRRRKRIAVLGDMLELGRKSPEYHYAVGNYAVGRADMLLTFGKEAEHIAMGARDAGMPGENVRINNDQNDIEKTGRELINMLNPGDVVLFKASRGIREERVIEYLKENFAV